MVYWNNCEFWNIIGRKDLGIRKKKVFYVFFKVFFWFLVIFGRCERGEVIVVFYIKVKISFRLNCIFVWMILFYGVLG